MGPSDEACRGTARIERQQDGSIRATRRGFRSTVSHDLALLRSQLSRHTRPRVRVGRSRAAKAPSMKAGLSQTSRLQGSHHGRPTPRQASRSRLKSCNSTTVSPNVRSLAAICEEIAQSEDVTSLRRLRMFSSLKSLPGCWKIRTGGGGIALSTSRLASGNSGGSRRAHRPQGHLNAPSWERRWIHNSNCPRRAV